MRAFQSDRPKISIVVQFYLFSDDAPQSYMKNHRLLLSVLPNSSTFSQAQIEIGIILEWRSGNDGEVCKPYIVGHTTCVIKIHLITLAG